MARSKKKAPKLTTNEALELLLGRKAAKRLRQLAKRVAMEEAGGRKNKRSRTKRHR